MGENFFDRRLRLISEAGAKGGLSEQEALKLVDSYLLPKGPIYFLNPDFRRTPPHNRPYCVRCQKEIKQIAKAIKVSVDWETWQVWQDNESEELVGADCWRQIIK